MLSTDILFLDGEFTKLRGELLELAIVDYNGDTIYYQRFRPKNSKEWKRTERIHHITPEMVKDCPFVEQEREKIQAIINKAKVVISKNISSDRLVLNKEGINIPRVFDIQLLEDLLLKNEKTLSLKDLAKSFGEDNNLANWHCSKDDAFVTYCLFLDLMIMFREKYTECPSDQLKAIRYVKQRFYKNKYVRRQKAKGIVKKQKKKQ